MKKVLIIFVSLLLFVFISCNNDDDYVKPKTTSNVEPIVSTDTDIIPSETTEDIKPVSTSDSKKEPNTGNITNGGTYVDTDSWTKLA